MNKVRDGIIPMGTEDIDTSGGLIDTTGFARTGYGDGIRSGAED